MNRTSIRAKINQFFVKHPLIGQAGYDLLRWSGIDRSTRGAKTSLKKLANQGFTPRHIIDIGANYGGWSRVAKSIFSEANFLLIEPQEEMRPFLDRFCAQNPGSRWVQAGAGAEVGELDFTIWDDHQGSAFLSPEVRGMTRHSRHRTVPVITLDSIIAKQTFPMPNLVKIDVQGFELNVLQGAIRLLQQTEMFIVEVRFVDPEGKRPTFYKVVEWMEAYGYRIHDLFDVGYHPADGTLSQVDICFTR